MLFRPRPGATAVFKATDGLFVEDVVVCDIFSSRRSRRRVFSRRVHGPRLRLVFAPGVPPYDGHCFVDFGAEVRFVLLGCDTVIISRERRKGGGEE